MVKLSENGKKALNDLAERIAKEKKIPGFAFGATTVDEELIFKTGGFKVVNDPSSGAVDKDTVFWICSMTKLLAHISALQLIEQGKLTPDTPVSQFFPEFAHPVIVHDTLSPKPSYHPATTPILVKHLLNFSSGLFYNYNAQPDKPKNSTMPIPMFAEQDPKDRYGTFFKSIMGDLPGIPIKFEPGTDFVYGYSSDVLGFIVEKVTGKSLEQYLKDHVLGPLGLHGSFYVSSDIEEKLLKLSFRSADGGLEPWAEQTTKLPERDPAKTLLHFGGVGYFTSLSDYLTLLRHILQIYSGKVTDGILTQATVRGMFVPASPEAGGRNLDLFVDSYGDPGNRWSTALAVCGADWPKRRRKGTAFWSGWAGTYYWMDPSTGIAAVFGTQIVPSRDPVVLGLYSEFEETLYASLES